MQRALSEQIILQMFFDAAGNNDCQWEAALLSIVKLEAWLKAAHTRKHKITGKLQFFPAEHQMKT